MCVRMYIPVCIGSFYVYIRTYIHVRICICISVLPRNILRLVEVHATLSVHSIRGGCRKALI